MFPDGRGARGAAARRELMDVAIDCFARSGYQATSIDRIARAAGVTKGALYYHFKDKEELLFEAVKQRVGQFERRVVADLQPIDDAADGLRRLAGICLAHATRSNHRRLIVTLMVEALDTNPRLEAEFRAMMQRFRGFLRSIVEHGQATGQFTPTVDPGRAADIFAGALMGTEIQYYQDPKGFDLPATLDAFVDQYILWLTRPTATRRGSRTRRT